MKNNTINKNILRTPSASDESWRKISDESCATIDEKGRPRSLFGESIWNIEAYGNYRAISFLYFTQLTPLGTDDSIYRASAIQVKQVMFFLINDNGPSGVAPSTLREKLGAIRDFCIFSAFRGQTLYEAMGDIDSIKDFASIPGVENKCSRLHKIFKDLSILGKDHTGVEIPFKQAQKIFVNKINQKKESRQFAVIPTRIYSKILSICNIELDIIEAAASDLVSQIKHVRLNKQPNSLASDVLVELFNYHQQPITTKGLFRVIGEVKNVLQILILAYTGMRHDEVDSLPYDCLKVEPLDGVVHYIVEGVSSKTKGRNIRRARWVTSRSGARAITIAKLISSETHSHFGSTKFSDSIDGSHLLFCRSGLSRSTYFANLPQTGIDRYLDALCARAELVITKEDVIELKRIDFFRAWDSEKEFSVGAAWPFTRHQLRRTLAVYAHRSGLVTLDTLKRQLHHLTNEMAMYYTNGSAFAENFIGEIEDHFAFEWRSALAGAQFLGYTINVLQSEEKLSGGHAKWVQSNAVKTSPVSVYSREEARRMFKEGLLAHQDTPLGGCASTTPCKMPPLEWLQLECLKKDCKHLIIHLSRLQRVAKAQKARVEALLKHSPDSVEYRIESETLETLLNVEAKILSEGQA
ncbi:Phage integrase family protein [Paraburkholderia fungorum]|uniref:Phage integrase family protein n=1 Tax=Paraburkholderia fungorum TaxID=134537 RepID=A0A1H1I581_9BURK|nr:tyrosine-type recombinase/integrase [Paraburkholderia fungorum]SDR32855.1 Phage integrase family protein [Paraburkholderia fungorum]